MIGLPPQTRVKGVGIQQQQDKETLLLTYNALGKSIASYAAPVWSINASDSSFKKIQTAQNAALWTATGAHKMASIDHLHQESLTLRVKDHSNMLFAQYLVNCLEEDHVCHGITTQEPRPMKETPLQTSLNCFPRLGSSRMESHQNLHTREDSVIQLQRNNRVLKKRPPPPKTTMHSFTTTVRTLPSIAGLQAQSARRTKRHLYRLWSWQTPTTCWLCSLHK